MDFKQPAPGGPGIPPRWTSSAKIGVGTALSPTSRVWFTLSHGILNEIYYPRVDLACTRDMGLDRHGRAGVLLRRKARYRTPRSPIWPTACPPTA